MNKLMKFSRAILAIAIMLCVALPTLAHDFEVNGIYYNYLDKTAKTVKVTYKGSYSYDYSNEYTGSVTIPSSVTYSGTTYSVTSIDNEAFYECSGLTSVTIPYSVTKIGSNAFSYCSGLTSITIPNSVTSIGGSAFRGCSGLTSVTIPNSVTSIGWSTFHECTGLTSVTIPNSVTSIDEYAFYGCSGLTEVNITDLSAWCKIDFDDSYANPLYYAKKLKLNGVEITNLVIPNDITQIKQYAFYNCSGLTSITIPNSVTSIGDHAFSGCRGLTSITIPNSVTSIGDWAFRDCDDLTEVNFNAENCTSMGSYNFPVFENCPNLKTINIGNSVKTIPKYAFRVCFGLTSVTIPNSVTSIGEEAFSGCTGLTEVTIPNSVTSIGEEAFEYCYGLKTIVSLNPTPPTCASSNSFASYNYSKATLYVPKDSYAKYFIDEVWGKFSNITKIETTATSISLNKSSLTLDKGATEAIKASITPSNTTLSFLYWTSDNPIVATVDQSGKITAISAGTAKITAMAIDGSNVSASCKVTVNAGETQIVLSQTEASLPVNDIMTLTYTITNSSKTATWSTSDADVAAIRTNSDGSVVIAGISDGVATITATANDGSGASASCVVTVGVGGIEGVEIDCNVIEVSRYDIHGRLLSEPARGINIVKMSDGTTRKEIVKE